MTKLEVKVSLCGLIKISAIGMFFLVAGCRSAHSLDSDLNAGAIAAVKVPPKLPSAGGTGELVPWGGSDTSQWRAEAVLANAVSGELNKAWEEAGTVDVLVSAPLRLFPSNFFPYGDGQSNTNSSFEGWKVKRPPLISTLILKSDGSSRVIFRLDSEWKAASNGYKKVEIRYREQNGSDHQETLDANIENGSLVATWNNPPAGLGWGTAAGRGVALVRPSPGFGDYFPISFQMPVRKTDELIASVKGQLGMGKPQAFKEFLERTLKPDRSSLKLTSADDTFFRNLRVLNDDIKNRIDELMTLHKADNPGISSGALQALRKKYESMAVDGKPSVLKKALFLIDLPNIYNTGRAQLPYMPLNIHGDYPASGFRITTGVGMGWTWVAEQDSPFKVMYTCFERRQADEEVNVNRSLPADEQKNFGRTVASGGGWHRIGDNQETIMNSLEDAPVAVVSGIGSPIERAGLQLPAGSNFVYGLRDVSVTRWLQPGESFVALIQGGKGDSFEGKNSNHHWYFFQQSSEVCTEEWVHAFGDPNTPNFLATP